MKSLKLFAVVCLMSAASFTAARAQLKTVKLPTTQWEIQKMATRKPVNRTIVLPAAEKIKQVQTALEGKRDAAKTKNYSLALPLSLDVRKSFVEGKANLGFDLASEDLGFGK